jgi:hypothetical protein
MTGMIRQALKTVARAQSLSQLPVSLGPWAGQRFLEVAPRVSVNTSDEIVRDRCSRLVDTLTARGVEVPRGLDLLWQATSAVVGDGNWKARVLKPSTTLALDRVSVEKMRKWSVLTAIADEGERPGALAYFGDLDVRGLEIAAAGARLAAELGLPPLNPAERLYRFLADHGHPARAGTCPDPAKARAAVTWLPTMRSLPWPGVPPPHLISSPWRRGLLH